MLVAQLDVSIDVAYERLRAHAAATDRTLKDIASDIVARHLQLSSPPPSRSNSSGQGLTPDL